MLAPRAFRPSRGPGSFLIVRARFAFPMNAGDPDPFLLFVAGEPDRGDEAPRSPPSRSILAGLVVPPILIAREDDARRAARASKGASWRLPGEQSRCVRLALELARDLGRSVRIVDVNTPEAPRELVERFVGSQAILPILVAPDGRRLEGTESFVPGTLRRFLRAPGGASLDRKNRPTEGGPR